MLLFQRLLGDDLLEVQRLHLVAGGSTGRVTGKPLLAGLQEFLRPIVIQALDDPFAPAQRGDRLLATQSFQPIFSSAEYCLRVARRISLMTFSAGTFPVPDFCLIFAPLNGYDEPEILRSQLSPNYLIDADAGHRLSG